MSGVIVRLDWLTGLKIAIGGALILWSNSTLAQVTPDTTLGAESSVVTPNVEIRGLVSDRISGGAIRGVNLFHSFQEFNVGEGRGVYFTNPQGIENILSRVTGANRSEILGRLGVLGNANLFLINPNGIVFGQNASLDVEGSFFATTAEAIALGEQGYFSATQPQQSSLLSVSPGALFFNQAASQPGNIINRGNLAAGKDLTLAGDNLDLQGQFYAGGNLTFQATDTVKIRDSQASPFLARSGRNLAIVGNQGIDILALNHPTQTPFVSGGNLNLISDGIISGDARFSSGGSFSIHNLSGGLANFVSKYDPIISSNGDVDVAANYTGASLLVESKGNIRFGGDINITTPDTSVPAGQDTATLSNSTALIMRSGQNTLAYGGVNSGSIPAFTSGTVPQGITLGGDVSLQEFNGVGGLVSLTTASGDVSTKGMTTNGGGIDINSAGAITTTGILNSSSYSPVDSAGNAGAIALTANGNITTGILDSEAEGTGDGGDITLTSNAGAIDTTKGFITSEIRQGSNGSGRAGTIVFTAKDNIQTAELDASAETGDGSSIQLTSNNGAIDTTKGTLYTESGTGNAGAIFLEAFNNITTGRIISETEGTGDGGNITLTSNAGAIDTTRGFITSEIRQDSNGSGRAGTIVFTAKDNIQTAELDASAETGDGSSIQLTSVAGGIDTTKGTLYTESRSGNGGAIFLSAFNNITTSRIISESEGTGNGGDITLTSNAGAIDTTSGDIVSQIRDGSNGTGSGGTIVFTAKDNIQTAFLNASAETGDGGNIQLTSNNGAINTTATLVTDSRSGNGGAIALRANGNINTGDLYSAAGGTRNGGNITLTSNAGAIDTTKGTLYTESRSRNAPNIQLQALNNIRTGKIISNNNSSDKLARGGDITLISKNGEVQVDGDISTTTYGSSKGGDIKITAGSLSLTDGAKLIASTFGQGDAGSVFVKASDSVSLVNGFIFSTVESGAVANGGKVEINAATLSLKDSAQILTSVRQASNDQPGGRGNAGSVNVDVTGAVKIEGINTDVNPTAIFSSVESGATGNAGNIDITANSVSLDNQGAIYAQAQYNAVGNAGNITIKTESFSAAGTSQIAVNSRAQGNSGNIKIQAGEFSMTSNAALRADLDLGGTALEGGNIDLIVDGTISLIGGKTEAEIAPTGESTRITLGVLPRGKGPGGNLTIKANSLVLKDGALIKASTQGEGAAGNININTNVVDISGSSPISGLASGLFTSTDTSFNAGDIIINTETFRIADSAGLSARTRGDGKGGNITVNARYFEAMNGGQLVTTTTGNGQAGNIRIDAKDRMTISGIDQKYNTRVAQVQANEERIRSDPDRASFRLSSIANNFIETGAASGLFAQTDNSSGDAGNVIISTQQLTLTNEAQISAATSSSGQGGNINIRSNSLTLNRGEISARTQGVGNGGNITIDADGLLIATDSNIITSAQQSSGGAITIKAGDIRLYGNSDITTNVGSGTGGGGNITLTANSIIAFGDSDILAFARNGIGGNISLNTPAFFGQNYRPAPAGTDPSTLDGNNRVDINASGAVSGVITVPDTSFIQNSLSELPENPIDTGTLIANSCIARSSRQQQGSFTITGSGGLPSRPGNALMSLYTFGNVRSVSNADSSANSTRRPWHKGDPIVEPQGVYRLPSGQLVLSRECS